MLSWKKPGSRPVTAHSNDDDDKDSVRDAVATDDDDESVFSRPRCGTGPCFSSGPTPHGATTIPRRNRNPLLHAKQEDG